MKLENVDRLLYLGGHFSAKPAISGEIHHRLMCSSIDFDHLQKSTFKDQGFEKATKVVIY